MTNTPKRINELRGKIAKLENTFKKGIPPFQGFTINIGFGGNSPEDIKGLHIGSISDNEKAGQVFFDLILNSAKNELIYWENAAMREIQELKRALNLES